MSGVGPLRRPAPGERHLRAAVPLAGVRLRRGLLPDPRGVPAPHRDVPLRRVPPPVLLAGGHELREDRANHGQRAGPGAFRGVQPVQQPDVPTSADASTDTNSADFGRINRNITAQSNFQRFVQLGFRLISSRVSREAAFAPSPTAFSSNSQTSNSQNSPFRRAAANGMVSQPFRPSSAQLPQSASFGCWKLELQVAGVDHPSFRTPLWSCGGYRAEVRMRGVPVVEVIFLVLAAISSRL